MANNEVPVNNQDSTEIHLLPEMTTLSQGMMVAVDSEPTGTKSFNLSSALKGKASAADVTALETVVAGKADTSDVNTALDSKANASTTYTKTEVDQAIGAIPDITVDTRWGNSLNLKKDNTTLGIMFDSSFDDYFDGTAGSHTKKLLAQDTSTGMIGGIELIRPFWMNTPNLRIKHETDNGSEYFYLVPMPAVDGVLTSSSGNIAWGNAVGFVKNVGALTDASTITATNLNNGLATLSTSQSALTIVDVVESDEVVNFAIEITPSVNCTLTIQKKVGISEPVTLKHSTASGNTLEANKTYQVTAVGTCWTLAEFEA